MTRHPGARGVRVLLPRPGIPAPAGERSAPKKSAVHPRRPREGPAWHTLPDSAKIGWRNAANAGGPFVVSAPAGSKVSFGLGLFDRPTGRLAVLASIASAVAAWVK